MLKNVGDKTPPCGAPMLIVTFASVPLYCKGVCVECLCYAVGTCIILNKQLIHFKLATVSSMYTQQAKQVQAKSFLSDCLNHYTFDRMPYTRCDKQETRLY